MNFARKAATKIGRTVYWNGKYIAETDAKVSVFDRGWMFADGVYEVTSILNGKLVDFDGHMVRMRRSLQELGFQYKADSSKYLDIHRKLIEINKVEEGGVYMQITRGVTEDRSFLYDPSMQPSILLMTQTMHLVNNPMANTGLKVITLPDLRWGRRDIKTTQLLYQSMGKMQAAAAGVDDAWMVDDQGFVTEGSSNNAWIIKDKTFVTRELSKDILHGITRATVHRLIQNENLHLEERPFSIEEAQDADEAFVTSSTNFVMPVVAIDGQSIFDGNPGLLTAKFRKLYIEESRLSAK